MFQTDVHIWDTRNIGYMDINVNKEFIYHYIQHNIIITNSNVLLLMMSKKTINIATMLLNNE